MINVIFFNVGQRSRSQVKDFGTDGEVLSQEIHMCNMKALPITVQKLLSRLKFFGTDKQTDSSSPQSLTPGA